MTSSARRSVVVSATAKCRRTVGRRLLPIIAVLAVGTVFMLSGGCAGVEQEVVGAVSEDNSAVDCLKQTDEDSAKPESSLSYEARIDRFLTCYIGPAENDDGQQERELKLLRGHIVVALLARYAAFKLTGEVGDVININFRHYSGLRDDARDVLGAIEDAEFKLRQASMHFPSLPRRPMPPEYLPNVRKAYETAYKMDRILTVADLAKEAATPTYRRTRRFVTGLLTALSAGSIGSAEGVFKDAYNGLRSLVVLRAFGKAYREDAKLYLEVKHGKHPEMVGTVALPTTPAATLSATVGIEDWRAWDERIVEACERIAKFADARHHCTPES